MKDTTCVRRWLFVVGWAAIIALLSSPTFSFAHMLAVVESLLRPATPERSTPASAATVVLIVRKTAHVLEYAVLAWLLWAATTPRRRHLENNWSSRQAAVILALVAIGAGADELRQAHSAGRLGQARDVAFDVAGGLLMPGFIYLRSQWHATLPRPAR